MKSDARTHEEKDKDYLKTFTFHGASIDPGSNGQADGTCLFCGSDKFFIRKSDGRWDCKVCGRQGNHYTFLSQLHEASLADTTSGDYKALEKYRGIPGKFFKDAQFARYGDRWLIPVNNLDGKFSNLLTKDVSGQGTPVMSSPNCSLHLIGGDELPKTNGPIYITEGPWDLMAIRWMLKSNRKKGIVVAKPGVHMTLKDNVLDTFADRDVYLCYDHDLPDKNGRSAGQEAAVKDASTITKHGKAKSVNVLQWPKMKKHFDLNDHVRKCKNPQDAWKELQGLFQEIEAESADPQVNECDSPEFDCNAPIERTRKGNPPSFQKVIREFRRTIILDKNMEDTIAVMFAVYLSAQLEKDPLWLFVVGPPGAGKTLALSSMNSGPRSEYISTMTPRCLVSGWKDPSGEDMSLLLKLKHMCLIFKDFTEVLSLAQQAREEIYSTLRGAYDGEVKKPFGNQTTRVYKDKWFSVVAGVTDRIHCDSDANMGERFLKVEFIERDYDSMEHVRGALRRGVAADAIAETNLKELVGDFLDRKIIRKELPRIPKKFEDKLLHLSHVIALMRAEVDRGWNGNLNYRPRAEIPTRLAIQLGKLMQLVAYVLGKKTIDQRTYDIVERVGLDTGMGFSSDILMLLYQERKTRLTADEISQLAAIPKSTLLRRLEDLVDLGAVNKIIEEEHDSRGRPAYYYQISEKVEGHWHAAGIRIRPHHKAHILKHRRNGECKTLNPATKSASTKTRTTAASQRSKQLSKTARGR